MNTKKLWLGMLTLGASMLAAPTQAVPISGAYVTDGQNSWVQDRVGDRIGTVNMIMCIMGNLKPDMMVNQGAYLALVDEQKCKGKADSSQATTTNAGEANASNYMSAVVLSTQPTVTDPLIMKAWLHEEEEHDGTTRKSVIYIYLEATAGKSAANPNGLFKMYFCGTSATPGSTTCEMEGTLKADATGLTFYNSESGGGGGGGPQITKLRLQQSDATGDNGFGKIQGFDNGSSFAYDFGYNPTYFRRSETGAADSCFARDQSRADFSTWRYGTYKQDGTRLETANPGFPVKFVDNGTTSFGFWSFWGLWLPPSAMADIGVSGVLSRQVAGVEQTLTVNKHGGKLWKFTRQAATLNDFKNTPLNYSACQATTHLPVAGDAPCTNYTLQWNGANLQAVGKTECSGGSGCSPTPLATPITLAAGEFTATGAKSMWIYSPAGDGVISVPATGDFSSASVVYYRTRNAVVPGSAGAPASLVCVNNCPAVYADASPLAPWAMITSLNWGGSGSQTVASNQNWGPVPTANAIGYSYDGMLKSAGSAIDYSHATQTQMQSYQGGLQSGYLIDGSDSVALASIKCDANGTANTGGANYCPFLANQASTSYQWETGPNQWNQYFGAANSAGPITFDPPKNLAFTVAADGSNIRAANVLKYAGSTLQLQSSGFGELQGIPGSCVDPDTGAVANCDQQSRWIPAFDIRDGATATMSDGTSYSIKYLERETRLSKMTGAEDTSCKAALALTSATALVLPGADAFDINPITKNGAEPTLTSSKPAVIQGVMQ